MICPVELAHEMSAFVARLEIGMPAGGWHGFYPESAVERTMKTQEVILRAKAKKVTWVQAAEIIGISDRQMRRWYQRYQEFGYDGLLSRRDKKASSRNVLSIV
jgi:hypothetical protein